MCIGMIAAVTKVKANGEVPFSRFWTLLGLSSGAKERSHHAVAAVVQEDLILEAGHKAWLAWRVAVLRVARSAASAASPVADAMVLTMARDGGEAWGRQRFWGSASWGLGSVVVGAIIDKAGLEIGLFGCSHFLSFLLLIFLLLRIEPVWHDQLGRGKKKNKSATEEQQLQEAYSEEEEEEEDPSIKNARFRAISMSMRGPNLAAQFAEKKDHSSQRSRGFFSFFSSSSSLSSSSENNDEENSYQETTSAVSMEKKISDIDENAANESSANKDSKKPSPATKKKKAKHCFTAVTRGLMAVRRCAPLRLALLNSIAFGTLVVAVDSILYMQLENELAVSRTLSGLATAASTAATFPVFWSSADIIARQGYWRVLLLAQCILPLRLVLHACITKNNVSYILLPIQLLHGPMFAAWISAAVELVDRLAPPDLRASTQSLLTMSYFTLGGCLGHLLWSTTFELYGGPVTYLLAAAASIVSIVSFAIAARSHLREDRQRFLRESSLQNLRREKATESQDSDESLVELLDSSRLEPQSNAPRRRKQDEDHPLGGSGAPRKKSDDNESITDVVLAP